MDLVLVLQELVREAVIVDQPPCRLPQRRIREGRHRRIGSVEQQVVNARRGELPKLESRPALQRRKLVRPQIAGNVRVSDAHQQLAGTGVGDTADHDGLQ